MTAIWKNGAYDSIVFSVLYAASLYCNKYVLSELGFTYPSVFQGWQTFVAVILLRGVMGICPTRISGPAVWNLLPHFVFYVGCIVAGSKALAALPIAVVAAVSNTVPAFTYLVEACLKGYRKSIQSLAFSACLVCITSAGFLFFIEPTLSLLGTASYWMLIHIILSGAQILYCHQADPQFSSTDKLLYSNIFSVIVLAPASLYLEEAFSALHFQHRRQLSFVIGCVLSAILGTLASLCAARLSSTVAVRSYALARCIVCVPAPWVFAGTLSFSVQVCIAVNIIITFFIPSHPLTAEPEITGSSKPIDVV